MSVEALADKFDTSAETIRRDLSVLADAGRLRKVHGGVRSVAIEGEGEFEVRMRRNALAKRLIAEKLVTLVQPRQTLFLDTGSTTLICAEALARIKKLTIITNSSRIAAVFSKGSGGADVYFLGGFFRGDNAQTVGPVTIDQTGQYRADNAIITIGAIDASGVTDYSNNEAQVARAMIAASAQVTIVADHTKFNHAASFNVCSLNDIDTLISNKAPDSALVGALSKAEVEVHC